MSAGFDPYFKWFGIPPHEQPPNHYRLLGIPLFMNDADVISNAADQRMILLKGFQSGTNSALSQKILNEVSAARVCLLSPDQKADYDTQLMNRVIGGMGRVPQAAQQAAFPAPTAVTALAPRPSRPNPSAAAASTSQPDNAARSASDEAPPPRKRESPGRPPNKKQPGNETSHGKRASRQSRQFIVILSALLGVGSVAVALIFFFGSGTTKPTGKLPGTTTTTGGPNQPGGDPPGEKAADPSGGKTTTGTTGTSDSSSSNNSSTATTSVTPNQEPIDADVKELDELALTAKTAGDFKSVAEKGMALAKRAIDMGKTDVAHTALEKGLRAARHWNQLAPGEQSQEMVNRLTLLYIDKLESK